MRVTTLPVLLSGTIFWRNRLRCIKTRPCQIGVLTVRLYGFSDYFVSLPAEWQQRAVLDRTAYENERAV